MCFGKKNKAEKGVRSTSEFQIMWLGEASLGRYHMSKNTKERVMSVLGGEPSRQRKSECKAELQVRLAWSKEWQGSDQPEQMSKELQSDREEQRRIRAGGILKSLEGHCRKFGFYSE